MNLQIIAGPAIGGVLAGMTGLSAAFAVNAASFAISALLLAGLGPLAPLGGPAPEARPGLMADTISGLRYREINPSLRALVLGMLVFISFAAMDNVALSFLVQRGLHGSAVEYGVTAAAFGVGMVAASLALAAVADRRPPAQWLIGGVALGSIGTVAYRPGSVGVSGERRWPRRRQALVIPPISWGPTR